MWRRVYVVEPATVKASLGILDTGRALHFGKQANKSVERS
jgi:hypothetical protein